MAIIRIKKYLRRGFSTNSPTLLRWLHCTVTTEEHLAPCLAHVHRRTWYAFQDAEPGDKINGIRKR